ncbi:hypothetical protein BJ138DRAFT_503586 [Hygrophoropsis aurantiaca]|uniref:Uncharacterized protein n=1 Tax=Hygrophoropsis aurantiaca TaxID=72124 RepID=A0ACB8AN81_9AGAM|nr:hypothetical protein BJ138DRAFT_503586 [Hygrophoropsis aurantiaca]
MRSWLRISFNNGRNREHPIFPWVSQIVRAVYEHRNTIAGVTIEPLVPMEDDLNYKPYVAYQLPPGSSEITRASLYVRAEPSIPASLQIHYSINLLTSEVHDQYFDIHTVVSEEAGSAVSKIRDWLKEEAIRINVSREERIQAEALEKQKMQERRKQKIRAFLSRLSGNKSGDISTFDEDGEDDTTCPLCGEKLVQCKDCEAVSCENMKCDGSKDLSIVGCLTHSEEHYCLSCLSKYSYWSPLGQCPNCNVWSCSPDLNWCPGRPDIIIPNNEGSLLIPTSHKPKPGPCSDCENDGVPSWRSCDNDHCWSRAQYGHLAEMAICFECSPNDGTTCICGQKWNCEDCSSTSSNNSVDRCPGCHAVYCGRCNYIDCCVICSKARLCNDCLEDAGHEDEDGNPTSEVVNLLKICQTCRGKICESCSKLENKSIFQCPWCCSTICKMCAELRACADCKAPLCRRTYCNYRRYHPCIEAEKPMIVD